MWQEAVAPYVKAGKLTAVGVVQEQHPDRTRLYRQWRELDWPIYVDSLNVIDHVTLVPIPMAIDEAGVIVDAQFRPQELGDFMKRAPNRLEVAADTNRVPEPDLEGLASGAEKLDAPEAWRNLGTALFHHGSARELDRAVAALEKAAKLDAENGPTQFALGAVLRRRYESPLRRPGDAQRAVEHWGKALEIDPNHYIRRRRLQQYGPRLDKPYNFYFWVSEARKDILARGDTPHLLTAEPMGSEVAPPQRRAENVAAGALANPDPRGRIHRDEEGLVVIDTLATPARVQPGHRLRGRITLRLNDSIQPMWNNEADNLEVWVGLKDGMTLVEHQLSFPNPETPETRELRQLEFEVALADNLAPGAVKLEAYALYYVCEEAGGVCYYLRQDFPITFIVDKEAPTLR